MTVAAPAASAKTPQHPGAADVKVQLWTVTVTPGSIIPTLKAKVRDLPAGYHALLVNAQFEITSGCERQGEVAQGTTEKHLVNAGDHYYTIPEQAQKSWRPQGSEDFGMSSYPEELLPESCPTGYAPAIVRSRTLSATVSYSYSSLDGGQPYRGPAMPMKAKFVWAG